MNHKELKNFLVFPAYYKGTSFEDIVKAFNYCLLENNFNIKVIGVNEAFPNFLMSDTLDDKDFFHSQLNIIYKIIEQVSDFSKILFLDFFFPGIDLLKYYFEKEKLNVRMGALLHGGTFLNNDLQEDISWLKNFELGYFDVFDRVYAPSQFLKEKCPENVREKVTIMPWGLDGFQCNIQTSNNKLDVIFPHRISRDKGIDDLIYIAKMLPEINFWITVPQPNIDYICADYRIRLGEVSNIFYIFNQESESHLKTLMSAKLVLSCAKQENFGYAIHKSVHAGAIPILPRGVCYENFFRNDFIYSTLDEAIELIKQKLNISNKLLLSEIYTSSVSLTFTNLLSDFYE